MIETVDPAGSSPISTSALPPPAEEPVREALARSARLGVLPTRIEALTDAKPKPIRLAAASPADDLLIPTLPMVEIETPDAAGATAVEPEPQAASDTQTAREPVVSKRRNRSALRARKARSNADPASVAAKRYARAPRWAQQMFETPWQSKAFSYIQ
jgi:hypothetical protein